MFLLETRTKPYQKQKECRKKGRCSTYIQYRLLTLSQGRYTARNLCRSISTIPENRLLGRRCGLSEVLPRRRRVWMLDLRTKQASRGVGAALETSLRTPGRGVCTKIPKKSVRSVD
jgi:hypothetical protein